jgi:hypothetical protein
MNKASPLAVGGALQAFYFFHGGSGVPESRERECPLARGDARSAQGKDLPATIHPITAYVKYRQFHPDRFDDLKSIVIHPLRE